MLDREDIMNFVIPRQFGKFIPNDINYNLFLKMNYYKAILNSTVIDKSYKMKVLAKLLNENQNI